MEDSGNQAEAWRHQTGWNQQVDDLHFLDHYPVPPSPTNQKKGMHPVALTPNTVFKNAFLKTIMEFESFEPKLPLFLEDCL